MTATSTLAHSSLAPVHSPLRSSGHGTPSHGSRSNTPVRVKPMHAHTADHSDRLPSRSSTPVRRSASAHAIHANSPAAAPHTSLSAHALNAAAPPSPYTSTARRRRLSVATYGDVDEDPAPSHGNGATDLISFQPQPLLDALAPRSQSRPRDISVLPPSPPSSVLELQLPLSDYLVLGPEASVGYAASLVAADPCLRCVAVVAPGTAHVLDRQDVDRLARYSHDPAAESLGSFLAGTPPALALRASAGPGAAAGLLLRRSEQFLPLVADEGGSFLGLLSRDDLAQALLGDGRHVVEPQSPSMPGPPAASARGGLPAAGHAGNAHGFEAGAAAAAVASAAAAGAADAGTSATASTASRLSLMPAPSMPRPPSPSGLTREHTFAEWPELDVLALAGPGSHMGQGGAQHSAVAAAHSHTAERQGHLHGDQLQHHHDQQQAEHGHQDHSSNQPAGAGANASAGASASVLGSMDHAGQAEGLRSISDPIRSGWDLLDNVDDALDVLGMVGQSVNAEAVGRRLLGEMANLAGGTSGTGWLFKYLYDGDCAICRTFQAMIEKMDNGMGRILFVDISNGAFNALEHGGINYRAAMETMHILSANGEVFKGVTAVIKLLAAVDANCAASLGSVTAVLPLLSLAYMLLSRNRHALSGAWAQLVRATGVDKAVFGRDILGPLGLGGSGLGLPRPPARPQGAERPAAEAEARGEGQLQPQPSM